MSRQQVEDPFDGTKRKDPLRESPSQFLGTHCGGYIAVTGSIVHGISRLYHPVHAGRLRGEQGSAL